MQIISVKPDASRMLIVVTAQMDDGTEMTCEVTSKADLDQQLKCYEQFHSDCRSLKALEGKAGPREVLLKSAPDVLDAP